MKTIVTQNGSVGAEANISYQEYLKRLGKLAEKWYSRHKAGLELRHQTGVLLNERFGKPGKRQPRHEKVLKEAGKKLNLAESDISRMRKLAYLFESFQDFTKQHPKVTTWNAVKELLSTLALPGGAQKKGPQDSTSKPSKTKKVFPSTFSEVKQSLSGFSATLKEVQKNLTKAKKIVLVKEFKALGKAISEWLEIPVSVEVKPVK
jgi:hypothetical protein